MENQQFRGGPTHKCLPIPPSCSDRAENTRNRKIWFFCFRALSRFFFQLQEKIFFRAKKIFFLGVEKNLDKVLKQKTHIFRLRVFSARSEQLGANRTGKSVRTPEICQWVRSLQAGLHIRTKAYLSKNSRSRSRGG